MNKKIVINSKTFDSKIKVKSKCKKKIFEIYPKDSFIVVLDDTGKVIIYENSRIQKNTFNNLREVIELFGSEFFKYPLSNTTIGENIINYYESKTGLKIREIYKYNFE